MDSQSTPAANTGEAVRARERYPEQAAHQRDHGGAESARCNLGDERVQLVPEPQGPSEEEAANGMSVLVLLFASSFSTVSWVLHSFYDLCRLVKVVCM